MNANEIKTGIEATGQMWGSDEWFTLWICGKRVGSIVGYNRAVSQLKGIARTSGIDIAAARRAYLAAVAAEVPSVQEPAPVKPAPQRKPSGPRCPHWKAIKRVFAICKEVGLCTKADEAMRRSFEDFLFRPVPSRSALGSRDWDDIGTAIKAGELVW